MTCIFNFQLSFLSYHSNCIPAVKKNLSALHDTPWNSMYARQSILDRFSPATPGSTARNPHIDCG